MKNQLVEIIKKYNMNGFIYHDGWGTDKDDLHSYCDYYESVLKPFINKEINVLELGVYYGCSSILWHDYLPKSKLVMLDIEDNINPKCWDIMDDNRFTYKNCDAYVKESSIEVKKLQPEGFDLIFDDGPHTIDSQVTTLELYLDQLNVGGKMFIEDIQDVKYFNTLEDVVKKMEGDYITEQIDLRENKNRYDDLIFVVTKR